MSNDSLSLKEMLNEILSIENPHLLPESDIEKLLNVTLSLKRMVRAEIAKKCMNAGCGNDSLMPESEYCIDCSKPN